MNRPTMGKAKLPSRRAVIELSKSKRTINDYAKATPLNMTDSYSPVVQTLRKVK